MCLETVWGMWGMGLIGVVVEWILPVLVMVVVPVVLRSALLTGLRRGGEGDGAPGGLRGGGGGGDAALRGDARSSPCTDAGDIGEAARGLLLRLPFTAAGLLSLLLALFESMLRVVSATVLLLGNVLRSSTKCQLRLSSM